MTIGMTGASGALGRATADRLLRAVEPREVVLTTRRPESLADLAARGVDVRRADFADPSALASAFKVLLIPPAGVGARLDAQGAAIAAAVDAGVRHVVYTSVPEPVPANPALVVADHAGTEQALCDSGLAWTALRNNLYAHLQVAGVQQAAAAGRLVTNTGAGATAYVTREDCAAAAAAVLVQDGDEGRAYDVTGPAAVRAADRAARAGEIGGREVEIVDVDDAAFLAGLRAAGLPGPVAELLTSFGAATRGGFFATVSSAVTDLTGRAPTAVAEVVRTAAPAP